MSFRNSVRPAAEIWGLGAFAFWVPDILTYAWEGADRGIASMAALTIIMPVSALLGYSYLAICGSRGFGPGQVAFLVVGGIWMLGPWAISLGLALTGEGFLASSAQGTVSSLGWLVVFTLVPIYTMIMATYDGTLFGLYGATVTVFLLSGVLVAWPSLRSVFWDRLPSGRSR